MNSGAINMYSLSPADGFRGVYPTEKSVYSYFGAPAGQPPEIEVKWSADELPRPVSDHPDFTVRALCFSTRAQRALKPFLDDSCTKIPLRGLGGAYSVFVVNRIVDALDRERSKLVETVPGTISLIRKAALRADRCVGENLFRVPEHRSHFFVSEHFVDTVHKNGLVGFAFERCELT